MQLVTFPLYPITADGKCACRDPKCRNAGKHPSVPWRELATPARVPQGYGIGLATGKVSDVVVVDIDVKNGKDGLASLEALGPVPATRTALTGSGGFHLYFAWPGREVRNSAGRLGVGIDVRGDGGYVVYPPSPHVSGGRYEWLTEPDAPLAEMPAWMLTALEGPAANRGAFSVKREHLERLAAAWKKKEHPLADRLASVCKGEPFADAGERDNVLFQLCADLAKARPSWDPDAVAALFAPSLSGMGADAPTVASVAEKLRRLGERAAADWVSRLDVTKEGKAVGCVANVMLALRNHEAWQGVLGYDERRMVPVLLGAPPWGGEGRDLDTSDGERIAEWLGNLPGGARIQVGARTAFDCAVTLAKDRPFDRWREWLDGLEWDGVGRLDTWLVDYAGVPDGPYARAVGAKWLIAAVARTFEPGCKVDTAIVLQGEQGIFKSTLLKELVGEEYFADRIPDIQKTDAYLYLQGPVIVELQEMAVLRHENEAVKSFVSQRVDRFRGPYERCTAIVPRRCVFAGTTNREAFLVDDTGNRRWWPVDVGECNVSGLRAGREALWAEAAARYRAGEPWWLDRWHEGLAGREQLAHVEVDAWHEAVARAVTQGIKPDAIERILSRQSGQPEQIWVIPPNAIEVRIEDLLTYALRIPPERQNRSAQMRVSAILKRIGFQRHCLWSDGVRRWVYKRSDPRQEKTQ